MLAKQNVITFLDFKNSRIIMMLNYGLSLKSARIEEFDCERKLKNENSILEIYPYVLENFINDNSCRQACFYVVVPDNYVAVEMIEIPTLTMAKGKFFLKNEIERICANFNDFYFQECLIAKNKKTSKHKVVLFKKYLVDTLSSANKKLNLNYKGVIFYSASLFASLHHLVKLKHSASALILMGEKDSEIFYSNKEKLITFYKFPYGFSHIQKSQYVGVISASSDACFEVFFNNLSLNNSAHGVQLDIDGDSKEKKKLYEKHLKNWKLAQKEYSEEEKKVQPLKKIISILSEGIKENKMPNLSTIYFSGGEEMKEMIVKGEKVEVKSISEIVSSCPMKDYLHLFGAILESKHATENFFTGKLK